MIDYADIEAEVYGKPRKKRVAGMERLGGQAPPVPSFTPPVEAIPDRPISEVIMGKGDPTGGSPVERVNAQIARERVRIRENEQLRGRPEWASKPPADPKAATLADVTSAPIGRRAADAIVAGAGAATQSVMGTVGGALSAGQWIANRVGIPESVTSKIGDAARVVDRVSTTPVNNTAAVMQQDFLDNPSLLLAPEYYTQAYNQGWGSMASMFVGGVGATGAARLAGMSKTAAATVGSTASGLIEAALEAGQTYREALDAGMDENTASKLAARVAAINAVVNPVLNKVGGLFDDETKGLLRRIIAGGGAEAVQEGVQTAVQNQAAQTYDPNRSLGQGVGQAMLMGAISGGAMGGADVLTGPSEQMGPQRQQQQATPGQPPPAAAPGQQPGQQPPPVPPQPSQQGQTMVDDMLTAAGISKRKKRRQAQAAEAPAAQAAPEPAAQPAPEPAPTPPPTPVNDPVVAEDSQAGLQPENTATVEEPTQPVSNVPRGTPIETDSGTTVYHVTTVKQDDPDGLEARVWEIDDATAQRLKDRGEPTGRYRVALFDQESGDRLPPGAPEANTKIFETAEEAEAWGRKVLGVEETAPESPAPEVSTPTTPFPSQDTAESPAPEAPKSLETPLVVSAPEANLEAQQEAIGRRRVRYDQAVAEDGGKQGPHGKLAQLGYKTFPFVPGMPSGGMEGGDHALWAHPELKRALDLPADAKADDVKIAFAQDWGGEDRMSRVSPSTFGKIMHERGQTWSPNLRKTAALTIRAHQDWGRNLKAMAAHPATAEAAAAIQQGDETGARRFLAQAQRETNEGLDKYDPTRISDAQRDKLFAQLKEVAPAKPAEEAGASDGQGGAERAGRDGQQVEQATPAPATEQSAAAETTTKPTKSKRKQRREAKAEQQVEQAAEPAAVKIPQAPDFGERSTSLGDDDSAARDLNHEFVEHFHAVQVALGMSPIMGQIEPKYHVGSHVLRDKQTVKKLLADAKKVGPDALRAIESLVAQYNVMQPNIERVYAGNMEADEKARREAVEKERAENFIVHGVLEEWPAMEWAVDGAVSHLDTLDASDEDYVPEEAQPFFRGGALVIPKGQYARGVVEDLIYRMGTQAQDMSEVPETAEDVDFAKGAKRFAKRLQKLLPTIPTEAETKTETEAETKTETEAETKTETEAETKTAEPFPGARAAYDGIRADLLAGTSLGNNIAFMKRFPNGVDASAGYNVLEAAVNSIMADVPVDERFTRARDLMKLLPTQGARSEAKQQFQQFSTPPTLAAFVGMVADPQPADVAIESSAGTGSLVAPIVRQVEKVIANEIDPARRAALGMAFPEVQQFDIDAEQLHNMLPDDIKPTLVVMNPPFSSAGLRGVKGNDVGYRHVQQSLARLAPGGRLVAILGEGARLDAPNARKFFEQARKVGTIVFNVAIDGKEYAKYGTTFGNQVILIEKQPTPDGHVPFTGKFDTVEEAYAAVKAKIPGRQQSGGTSPAQGPVAVAGPDGPVRDVGKPKPGRSGKDGGSPGGRPASDSASTEAGGGNPSPAGARPKGKPEPSPAGATGDSDGEPSVQPAKKPPVRQQQPVIDTDDFATYRAKTPEAWGAQPHQANIVETAPMAATEAPVPKTKPDIPAEAIENGEVSDLQLEAVALALDAHQQQMEDGTRLGFFIGDGTGVGKTREIAAIALHYWRTGTKRQIWVTFNEDLAGQAREEMDAIGGKEVPIKRMDAIGPKTEIAKSFPEGIVFVPYSKLAVVGRVEEESLRRPDDPVGVKLTPAEIKQRKKEQRVFPRVLQLLAWAGSDPLIVFDEAHKAKSAAGVASERSRSGVGDASNTGLAVLQLQDRLPGARVVYASGTGFTEPSNMAYATRLGLWGPGTVFETFPAFLKAVGDQGIGIMEILARDTKALGRYTSRFISFGADHNGVAVEFGEQVQKLTPEQHEILESAAKAWRIVRAHMHEAIKPPDQGGAGGGAQRRARISSAFYGTAGRFYRSIYTAAKVPKLFEIIDDALAKDESVVISLSSTGEAVLNRALDGQLTEDGALGLDDIDMSPATALIEMVRDVYPVVQYEEIRDPLAPPDSERTIWVPVRDANGNPVINKEMEAKRDELIKDLQKLRMPDSALDQIIQRYGDGAVAELTGRSQRLVPGPEGRRVLQKRSDNAVVEEAAEFQAGRKRIAVISGKASTGINLHAGVRTKNQQRRVHVILELKWSADATMQDMGRTHRTAQVVPPRYVLLTTDLGGEKRYASSIARRMAQLGALSRGSRSSTGAESITKYNFETKEGQAAVTDLLEELDRTDDGKVLLQDMGIELPTDDTPSHWSHEVSVKQFLNRINFLEPARQNQLFADFIAKFEAAVENSRKRGTLDEGAKKLEGDKFTRTKVTELEPRPGVRVQIHDIEVQNKRVRVPFEQALEWVNSGQYAMVRNKKNGRLGVASRSKSQMTDPVSGGIIDSAWVTGPGGTAANVPMASLSNPELFTPISNLEEMRAEWARQYEEAGEFKVSKTHILTGTITPVLDLIKGDSGILPNVRMVKVDGERLLGLQISPRKIDEVRENLGDVSTELPKTVADVQDALNRGGTVRLAGGATLRIASLYGRARAELFGMYDPPREVTRETVSFQPRHFVDTVEAMNAVLNRAPVIGVDRKKSSGAGAASSSSMRRPGARGRGDRGVIAADLLTGPLMAGLKLIRNGVTRFRAWRAQIHKTHPGSGTRTLFKQLRGGARELGRAIAIALDSDHAMAYFANPAGVTIENAGGARGRYLRFIVQRAIDHGERLGGELVFRLSQTGIGKLTRDQRLTLDRELRGTLSDDESVHRTARQLQQLFDAVVEVAAAVGVQVKVRDEATGQSVVKPIEEVGITAPRVYRDVDALTSGPVKADIIENLRRLNIHNPEGLLSEWIEFLKKGTVGNLLQKYMLDTAQADNELDASKRLLAWRSDRARMGTFYNQELDLPFHDPDAARALAHWLSRAATDIAKMGAFGQEWRQRIAREIHRAVKSGGDRKILREAVDRSLGVIEESPAGSRAVRFFTTIAMWKLGLAFLGNATQVINIWFKTDAGTLARAMRAGFSQQGRDIGMRSGATIDPVLAEMRHDTTIVGSMVDRFLMVFSAVERYNRTVAANAGAEYAQRLFAAPPTQRTDDMLRELGINVKAARAAGALTQADLMMAAKRMSDITQFRNREIDLPFFAKSPLGRLVSQFRTFAFHQARFVTKETVGQMVDHGAFDARAWRNLAITLLVYPAAGVIVSGIRAFLAGDRKRKEDWIDMLFNALAGAGSLGLLVDVLRTTRRHDRGDWIEFLAGPTAGLVADSAVLGYTLAFGPKRTEALARFWRRHGPLGSLTRRLGW